jgi:cupin fold WbuC family metalloprotein
MTDMRRDFSESSLRLREEAPGIFYTDDKLVTADQPIIAFLKQAAIRSPTRRARLCAHPSAEAAQHDMLIASHRDTYVAPHRHRDKSETLIVIEGSAQVLLFDDAGHPTRAFAIAAPSTAKAFFYRMPAGVFHSLLIASEFLIFVESTTGPFRRRDSENAPWAPRPEDVDEGRAFCRDVNAKLTAASVRM